MREFFEEKEMWTGSNGDQMAHVEMRRSASWTRDGVKEKPGIQWKYSAGKGVVHNGDAMLKPAVRWKYSAGKDARYDRDETSVVEKWKNGENSVNGDLWMAVEKMSIMEIVGV